jgi:hypothetical protein
MDWFLVFYLCIIIVIFPVIIVLSLWRYRNIKRLMENQALKRNGTVNGSFLLPHLKFSYKDLPVLVTSVPGSRYRRAKTEVNITLLRPLPSNLTITPESIATRVGKKLWILEIQLGSDEFDREFLLQSKDELFMKNILNYTIQNKLLEMKNEKPSVSLHGTWLTVHVPKVVKTEEDYDQLFDLSFAFVDRIYEL